MTQAVSPPAEVSIIGLMLREFSRLPVAEQAQRKRRLEELLAKAIEPLPASDRIVLEALEGLVVAVLSRPEEALLAAQALAADADLSVCVGINHGPVKSVTDANGRTEFVGDGLVAVMTLANLATRGRLLASRSFRDALQAVAPHRASALSPVGTFTDDSVRRHELFTIDPHAARTRRRRFVVIGALAALGAIGAGAAVRAARSYAKRPALIRFEITPRGVVFVDGQMQGTSPPLKELEVSPGRHTIEVRNASQPPLRLEMSLKPAEEMKVTHAFATPRPVDRKAKKDSKEESFMDGLRRRLGI